MKVLARVLLSLSLLVCSAAYASLPPHTSSDHAFAMMVQRAMPAVVNINVQGELPPLPFRMPRNNKQRRLPNPFGKAPRFQDMGSGMIVDAKKGYILTNAHVVRHAKTIIITLSDGRRVRAKMLGEDKLSDLALLQIKAKHLQAIPFADSEKLHVGDFVAAIGNPFGLHQTVTSGVVSAMNRTLGLEGPKGYENFIQTDAPINPGNSGGALINMKGELVGVNTAILAPLPGNVGIGFAIPSNMARRVMNQLIKYGEVHRGMLGVIVQDLTPNLADAFEMPGTKGALITQVNPKSSGAKAGLKTKDVVMQVNETYIKNAPQLRSIIGLIPVGETVTLKVKRGSRDLTMDAVIEAIPKPTEHPDQPVNFLMGVRLQNYDAFSPQTGEIKGVQVTHVDDSSNAWLGRLRPGDVVLTANGARVTSIDQLLGAVDRDKNQLLLRVWRAGGTLFIVIT